MTLSAWAAMAALNNHVIDVVLVRAKKKVIGANASTIVTTV